MTAHQKSIIDNMDGPRLTHQISAMSDNRNEDRDAIIAYCEKRLDALNVSAAMVEFTPLDDFGDM